jgi:diguanylate cyclase (GGDEF)-like protein
LRLRQLLERDALTGIANRRHFDQTLVHEWRRARRSQTALSLLMIDVDHFKLYNDRYGHQAGDHCLRELAQELARCFQRSGELLARYGGEEFVVIQAGSSADEARHSAEMARQAIEQKVIPHAASPVAPVVTISIGVATLLPSGQSAPEQLLAAADQALYAAKRGGRNRVATTSPAEPSDHEH